MTNNFVATTYTLCPVCGEKSKSTGVAIHKRLKDLPQEGLFEGWELCPTHKQQIEDGYVIMIVLDGAPPEDFEGVPAQIPNSTGDIMAIRKEAFTQVFTQDLPPNGIAFLDKQAFEILKAQVEQQEETLQ